MNEEDAYQLSEAVGKGRHYTGVSDCWLERDPYILLPEDTVSMLSRVKYLPKKALMQRIIYYAILTANSLINGIFLERC